MYNHCVFTFMLIVAEIAHQQEIVKEIMGQGVQHIWNSPAWRQLWYHFSVLT